MRDETLTSVTDNVDEKHSAESNDGPWEPPIADAHLVALVTSANKSEENSFGMTITVPGGIISGQMVGYRRWLKAVGAQSELMDQVAGYVLKRLDEGDPSEVEELPSFVHLLDAQFFVGGDVVPSGDGMHWRARVSEISGWSLGRMGVTSG